MNIYILTQDANTGYDTYDSVVVTADSEEQARVLTPNGIPYDPKEIFCDWCSPENVTVELIGIANHDATEGVVLSSFNAG